MYSHSEGDPETPRSDSPVIFVITDTRDRVHQYPHEAHLQQDWPSSNKGEQSSGVSNFNIGIHNVLIGAYLRLFLFENSTLISRRETLVLFIHLFIIVQMVKH